jgi:hypothetical protein
MKLCKQHEETIDHLTSGCPILENSEYSMRKSKVDAHLHYSVCKALGTVTTDKWYTQTPERVCERENVCVLWNQGVQTDTEVTANKPDIIIKNKKEKTAILIDVAIPADRNVMQKEAGKKLKYKSLCIEIQPMWNMKCMIITVVIGATRIVTKGLKKNLEAIPGKRSIYLLYVEHHTQYRKYCNVKLET